ncbi:MAG TPA: hypothetical protein VGX28_07320 [Frankiaceae bacterium]|jgi:ABC-type glycerol-3-phosphate transport system substrate-binding protein|nr:hypothetical protein [Frankiaceae bacterium]
MTRLIVAALACAVLAGCANDPAPGAQLTPSGTTTTAAPTPTVPVTTPAATVKPTVAPATPLPTDLADGRHYAYLKTFDAKKLTLSLDVVQFLTGEAAEKAAQEDGQEAYDYYVRNQNKRVRTLTVAPTVRVFVNTLAAGSSGNSAKDVEVTTAKLASYFASGEAQQRVFYVTLSGHRVVRINEQYLP